MVITEAEAKEIKEHLTKQLENFPEDKQSLILQKINEMTSEQLEEFIKRNNLTHLGGQCIFCSIVANQTPSHKIMSDKENVAVLDINPISKGHCLIIPKEHSEEVKDSTNRMAQEIARRINEKFRPEEIKLNKNVIMEHGVIEVIPIYGNEGERKKATDEELEEIKEKIKEVKKPEVKKEKEKSLEKKEAVPVLPPRIP